MTDISASATTPFNTVHGRWSVSRIILDRKGMGRILFNGTSIIDHAKFEETGETLIAGQTSQSSRTYNLLFSEERAIVQLPDGREFIRFDGRPVQHVHHLCGDDTYEGRFFFLSPNAWGEVWRVTGPHKDYKSIGRYTRQS